MRGPGDGGGLQLWFAPELRFLLASRHRGQDVLRVSYDLTSSLGHVVQSLGVPLTEVGALTVDGWPVPPEHRPGDGTLVEVAARPRPQPLPPSATGFVLDVHLGALARRLRLVGLDTAYANDADDPELVRRANAERRVLLTRDRGLLRRRTPWLAAFVRGTRPDEQLLDVLTRFRPPLAPWTRCPACNGDLAPVAKAAVAHLLEPGTRRTYDTFTRCRSCGRVYWRGAHGGRLEATVTAARAAVTGRG
ncbi:Mut7-C RNAse domain-containing protein [Streptomyces sp. JJ38]|uniref:Mut7-C RNAse domain-containing protein n=1 Tax=Streptomyces sp. JJ38 TaxID=2738128 RepID=UPI0027E0EDD9|nr:Mut7-C RNAse domain-containing protein [Streptomyces sp. JJ38]